MDRTVRNALIGTGIAVVAVVNFYLFAPTLWTWVDVGARRYGFELLLVALVAGSVFAAIEFWPSYGYSSYRNDERPVDSKLLSVALTITSVVLTAGLIAHLISTDYRQNNAYYTASTSVVENDPPKFEERPPYVQAYAMLPRRQDDLRGKIQEVTYVNKSTGAVWTGIVDGDSFGRKAQGVIEWTGPDDDASNFNSCEFSGELDALSGRLWNDLIREIRKQPNGRSVLVDTNDSYGYCDENNEAVLIVPMTRTKGWVLTSEVPAGIAVIRNNADIKFDSEVERGEYPGPVYPISLAKDQQTALRSTGSFGDHFHNRTGWIEDGRAEFEGGETEGAEEPNRANTGQFALITEDGRSVYATPVLPKRSGRQIAAVAIVENDHVTAGEYNTLVVHKLSERRKSNDEIVQDIEGSFIRAGIPNVTSLRIMEVTPRDPDIWVATIGKTLEALYRAEIAPDGSACIYDLDTDKLLRCSSNDETGVPEEVPAPTGTIDVTNNLSTLTNEELIELNKALDAEIENRLLENDDNTE